MSPPGDRLKLSDPHGSDPKGNSATGNYSEEEKLVERAQIADARKRIAELERSNTKLEKLLEQRDKASRSKPGGQGSVRHVAHAEGWKAICTAPDLCKVGKDVVAFNSFATLDQKHTASVNVKARGTAVYRKGDFIKNVQADAGKHVVSGTSLGSGHVKILDGHENVKVNGIPVARHDSRCLINCDASGVGGAQGKIVTEQKNVGGELAPSPEMAAAGERTSEKLAVLKKARAAVADGMVNFDAADELVNFARSNELLDDWIAQLKGAPGTAGGYAVQVARGLLGFGKDLVMGAGELLYEGVKAVPKLVQLNNTQRGQLLTQLDAKILAENIKLGNITPEIAWKGALNIGKAVVKPVTDPWAKGQYVESITRGTAEVGSFGLGWLKSSKGTRIAKAAEPSAAGGGPTLTISTGVTGGAKSSPASAGVHIKSRLKPEFSGDWNNYRTFGLKVDPMRSPEGRRLVRQFEEQGMSETTAIKEARELIKTGSSLPMANPMAPGDKLFKVVSEGGSVGAGSPYWATEAEIGKLRGLTYDQIADRFGLPLASQQGAKFQVVEITAFRNGTTFTSAIAPTNEIGKNGVIFKQAGGGLQTLLTDRSIFTQPRLTNITFP